METKSLQLVYKSAGCHLMDLGSPNKGMDNALALSPVTTLNEYHRNKVNSIKCQQVKTITELDLILKLMLTLCEDSGSLKRNNLSL